MDYRLSDTPKTGVYYRDEINLSVRGSGVEKERIVKTRSCIVKTGFPKDTEKLRR